MSWRAGPAIHLGIQWHAMNATLKETGWSRDYFKIMGLFLEMNKRWGHFVKRVEPNFVPWHCLLFQRAKSSFLHRSGSSVWRWATTTDYKANNRLRRNFSSVSCVSCLRFIARSAFFFGSLFCFALSIVLTETTWALSWHIYSRNCSGGGI